MGETPIQIRPVEPEDWPDVAEIFEQPGVIAGTLQLPFRSKAAQRKRLEEIMPNRVHLGAVIEGKLIGTAALIRQENRRAHVGTIGMGVHDAYQGRGAGDALMAALLTQADRWLALRRVELTVYADNARAIGLYEKHGFVREGLHRDFAFRDGAFIDALAMARLAGG
jgi:L-phenylalanine/L-methionine N-acetyltransferase